MPNISVKKDKDNPESKEILAEAIIRISESFIRLKQSGLNESAIISLIYDATKIPKRDIKTVLDSLARLKGWYCR